MQEFQVGDATARGYLALPQSGTGPGVLVLHAWWGLVPTFVEVCDRLAAAGFVAFAPDLYHGRTAATIAEAEALQEVMEGNDGARLRPIAHAGLERLLDDPRVTRPAIGIVAFSMGVYYALELSALQPEAVAAVVAFYGLGDADQSTARAGYQGHFAEHDQYQSLDEMRSMEADIRAAGHETDFHVYPGAAHWFFEADRPDAYDAEAAQLAWDRTVTFLQRRL